MRAKHEMMLFVSMIAMSNMIDIVSCRNKRIKIYVPEYTKHVHHHHVKKVPVYIVTKDRPRVMYASHIEDDYDDGSLYGQFPRTEPRPDYEAVSIRGIYGGHESHEDVGNGLEPTTSRQQPRTGRTVKQPHKSPYAWRGSDLKSRRQTGRHNRPASYDR